MNCCDTPDLRREPEALGLPISCCASCGEREIDERLTVASAKRTAAGYKEAAAVIEKIYQEMRREK